MALLGLTGSLLRLTGCATTFAIMLASPVSAQTRPDDAVLRLPALKAQVEEAERRGDFVESARLTDEAWRCRDRRTVIMTQ